MSKRNCRVVVFIDVQNVHNDFRRAFVDDPDTADSHIGAFNPMELAKRLVAMGPDFEEWTLSEVRAYAGSPLAHHQPTATAAHDRQMETWRKWGVIVQPRPLYYPPGEKPRQKGVDVELAIDVFRMAVEKQYEIAVIVSTDQDIKPALEAVAKLRGSDPTPRICGVRYGDLPQRLTYSDAKGNTTHCFRLVVDDYVAVMDPTDYRIEPSAT